MYKRYFMALCALLSGLAAGAQNDKPDGLVVFYNVENLFDPEDDPHTQDNDFTPSGKNAWTWTRLAKKRNSIAKTIIAIGEGNAPVLVGLCEVENHLVLKHLVERTPLSKIGYGIVHHDSPDPRGIDVALLYRTDRFKVLHAGFYKVTYESGSSQTREILYAKGLYACCDTLHVLVNHWPSKLDGEKQSMPKRMAAAQRAKNIADSILQASPAANIILMGDFNDTPESVPLTEGLQALPPHGNPSADSLYNLMLPLAERGGGSLRYRGQWELIDQFIVSGRLLQPDATLQCLPNSVKVFKAPFLLEDDEKYLGEKPFRTYQGPTYKGGVSDHLPVVLPVQLKSRL
ncbi:MAG: endonuclease [Prevotellaceae bacterium]|nr:endonuclease [Prevotellaceae bacterium]